MNLPFMAVSVLVVSTAVVNPSVHAREGRVEQSQAASTFDQSVVRLASDIAGHINKASKVRVAVLPFADSADRISVLGQYLADSLTTELFAFGTLEIYERSLLAKVLAEHKLAVSGLVDAGTAKEIGKLIGVDAIVAGTLAEMADNVGVNVRLIETENGRVFAAARTTIAKDLNVRSMLDRVAAQPSIGSRSPNDPAPSGRTFSALGPGTYAAIGGTWRGRNPKAFGAERDKLTGSAAIRSIVVTREQLQLNVLFSNESESPWAFFPGDVHLIDSLGQRLNAISQDGLVQAQDYAAMLYGSQLQVAVGPRSSSTVRFAFVAPSNSDVSGLTLTMPGGGVGLSGRPLGVAGPSIKFSVGQAVR